MHSIQASGSIPLSLANHAVELGVALGNDGKVRLAEVILGQWQSSVAGLSLTGANAQQSAGGGVCL